MKVFVTKYALTTGIFQSQEGKQVGYKYFSEYTPQSGGACRLFLGEQHYCLTMAGALVAADLMRTKKIESLKKQIAKLGTLPHYSEIKFHLILFPIPLKKTIIDRFVSMADFYKNS